MNESATPSGGSMVDMTTSTSERNSSYEPPYLPISKAPPILTRADHWYRAGSVVSDGADRVVAVAITAAHAGNIAALPRIKREHVLLRELLDAERRASAALKEQLETLLCGPDAPFERIKSVGGEDQATGYCGWSHLDMVRKLLAGQGGGDG